MEGHAHDRITINIMTPMEAQQLMDTFADIQAKLAHLQANSSELNAGMEHIASGLVMLQMQVTEQTALVQQLRDQLAGGTAITQEQVDALGDQADTIQATLSEALGHEQAIEDLLHPEEPPPAP
jgi:uncharacterized phage infection (PIP) family protein YhgE